MKGPEVGEISKALYEGYRVAVHARFFPFEGHDKEGKTITVHAQIDHAARAIYCSQEWLDALPKVQA